MQVVGDQAIGRGEQAEAEAGAFLDLETGGAQFREPRFDRGQRRGELRGEIGRGQMDRRRRGARRAGARRARSCVQFEREVDGARRSG